MHHLRHLAFLLAAAGLQAENIFRRLCSDGINVQRTDEIQDFVTTEKKISLHDP